MKRRNFIKATAITAPLLGVFPAGLSSMTREFLPGKLEKRLLGKTGLSLSIIGFGGITVRDADPDQARELVGSAIDKGVNWFDSSPRYAGSEPILGPALEPYRKDVFLACKTRERTKDDAERELEQSLKDLKTDHFDLYQLHVVSTMEDVDTIFSKNGALKTLIKAREDGRTKYLGFSAHSVEAAMELMRRFEFDTILFPFNLATWYKGNFGAQVLQVAKDKGMGILALKSMAERKWDSGEERSIPMWYKPYTEMEGAQTALRFTLSHPITGALPPGNPDLFKMGMDIGLNFKPLSEKETDEIKQQQFYGTPMFSHDS